MLALRSQVAGLKSHCRFFRSTKPILCPILTKNQKELDRIIVEQLKNRDLISVRGAETKSFLQGLITNDIQQLDGLKNFAAMYTLFLNRGGRVLYDALIYHTPKEESYFIECDREISTDLCRYLRQYRVRRKIDIDAVDTYNLWVAFSPHKNISINSLPEGSQYATDPRNENLGTRLFRPKTENWVDLSEMLSKTNIGMVVQPEKEYNYQIHRYRHGIAEGVEELPPSKCFPLESNVDYLNGISFHKGCYVGQELTARTHHTGVVRKRLLPLRFNSPGTKKGEEIVTEDGTKVGLVRGSYDIYGLGVLNVDKALGATKLLIDGKPCSATKPDWWPSLLTNKKIIADV